MGTKKFLSLILAVIMVIACTVVCFSHQGRTDSRGGHHDHINGGYHFHHGLPAHQHANGVCLYSPPVTQSEDTENATEKTEWWETVYSVGVVIAFIVWVVCSILASADIREFTLGLYFVAFWPVALLILMIVVIVDAIKNKKGDA